MHTAHVAQQSLHLNCLQMIQKTHWPPNSLEILTPADSMSGEKSTKPLRKLHLKPSTVSEVNIALEKTWENFPQNKAVLSFRKWLREYMKSSGRHSEHLLSTQKSVHTYGVYTCLEHFSVLIMSKCHVVMIKRSVVLTVLRVMQ